MPDANNKGKPPKLLAYQVSNSLSKPSSDVTSFDVNPLKLGIQFKKPPETGIRVDPRLIHWAVHVSDLRNVIHVFQTWRCVMRKPLRSNEYASFRGHPAADCQAPSTAVAVESGMGRDGGHVFSLSSVNCEQVVRCGATQQVETVSRRITGRF